MLLESLKVGYLSSGGIMSRISQLYDAHFLIFMFIPLNMSVISLRTSIASSIVSTLSIKSSTHRCSLRRSSIQIFPDYFEPIGLDDNKRWLLVRMENFLIP